jgi:hypothetical protein
MRMNELEPIEDSAERILVSDPDPVVRFRLLRDVLRIPSHAGALIRAHKEMLKSRWVLELEGEQHEDGGWGRFHSQNTKARRKIKTTEGGVGRGLVLGLNSREPIFRKTARYLRRLLEGSIDFPDPPESNERWATGTRLFVAATLAQLQPQLPALDEVWDLWAAIACRTFASGKYDPDAEIQAHRELSGISQELRYLQLRNRYTLTLLGSRAQLLPGDTEKALLNWVWRKEGGIGYLGVPLSRPPRPSARSSRRWFLAQFASQELLSRYPSWRPLAERLIGWLWSQRNEDGLWDFGPGVWRNFRLSESWRRPSNRRNDHSTRVLLLLRKYYDSE